MTLFKASDSNQFSGPHLNQKIAQTGSALKNAKAAMIMIHGRGASAESIVGLVNEFDHQNKISFLAPQASDLHGIHTHFWLQPIKTNQD